MNTRTRFVFLMHPKEFKEEKAGTGRLTHLCLTNSEIRMGVSFEQDEGVQSMIADPKNLAVLLYPGPAAMNLSEGQLPRQELGDRQLLVFLLDATWACARKMLRLSPSLQRLPRVSFSTTRQSRFVIKQQPQEGCLSTLEATHELLTALSASQLDEYPAPDQLLGLFGRMQDYQIKCAADPLRGGYRRAAYSLPEARAVSTNRRRRVF
jgi:DTW domain-containing protein